MKPGRPCTICASAEAALQCDGLIASGVSLTKIAATLNVSKFVVSRHKRHSALKLTDAEAKSLPEDRLETLYDRCDQLFHSLAANGDARAASDILKTQARLAEAAVAREEKRQQSAAETSATSNAVTPEQFDANKKKVYACYEKWVTDWGWVRCPFCENIKPVDPKIIESNFKAYQEQHGNNDSSSQVQ